MRELVEISERLVESVSLKFVRDSIKILDSPDRLIGIKGSRGVGKTTLLLQYIKTSLQKENALYVSLDDIYFTENRLIDLIGDFVKLGGTHILLDEVHKYPNWSMEIKNAYDRHPELRIVFTGSSMLKIRQSVNDLSRRAVVFTLQGFSLREYINFVDDRRYEKINLSDILSDHRTIAKNVVKEMKPLLKFNEYLETGYFPFFIENRATYHGKLRETIYLTLEADIPALADVSVANINKLKHLLYLISVSVPFKPNIVKLSERTGISRNTLKEYLHLLNEAQITGMLFSSAKGISALTKPEKLYLNHPNYMIGLAKENADIGTLRETFFYNQLVNNHQLNYSAVGDFFVDGKYTFEIGGKNKTKAQISGIENAWLALDGIEIGVGNTIPLWLFGFLY